MFKKSTGIIKSNTEETTVTKAISASELAKTTLESAFLQSKEDSWASKNLESPISFEVSSDLPSVIKAHPQETTNSLPFNAIIEPEVKKKIEEYVSNGVNQSEKSQQLSFLTKHFKVNDLNALYRIDPEDFNEHISEELVTILIKQTINESFHTRYPQQEVFERLAFVKPLDDSKLVEFFKDNSHSLTLKFANYAEYDLSESNLSAGLDSFFKYLSSIGAPLSKEQHDKIKADVKPLYIEIKDALSKTANEQKTGIFTKFITVLKEFFKNEKVKPVDKPNDLDPILYDIRSRFENVQNIFKESPKSSELNISKSQPSLPYPSTNKKSTDQFLGGP